MNSTATLLRGRIFRFLLLLPLFAPYGASAQLCTPTYTSPCSSGDYIQSFSTTGGSTNISNPNSGCNGNANNYIYYLTPVGVTAAPGSTVGWSLTNCPSFPEGFAIWVDFNQSGTFDAAEQVFLSTSTITGGATINGTFIVPLSAAAGLTRMRVRCVYNSTQITPCGSFTYGETEDYNFTVAGTSTGCTSAPAAGTINSTPAIICASTPVSLVLTGYTAGALIQWQSANSSNWVNIPGATAASLQLPSPTPTGFYRAVVTCPGTTFSSNSAAFQVALGANPPCQDSVWPGDANYDHVVDMLDPLAIGLAYNHVGASRAGASTNWYPQYATNWSTSFLNGVNHKNADCNGDSLVNTADVAAVTANYGQTHPKGFSANSAKVAGLPDLMADLTGINLIPGNMVTVPIRLGSAGSDVAKIYGIAGRLQLQGVPLGAPAAMAFNPTWIGGAATTLSFAKATSTNVVDWAVSRTNQLNTSGNGVLGTVSFLVPNVSGTVTFHLQDVTMIDNLGNVLTDYNVMDMTGIIHATGISTTGNAGTAAAIVPNPSSGAASLSLHLDQAADLDITVTDMAGRKVWNRGAHVASGASSLQLPGMELAPGIYLVSVRMAADGALQILQWVKQ